MSSNVSSVAGAIVFAGGVLGYVQARSRPSLIAGSVIGFGLMTGGYLISKGDVTGNYISATLGTILALSMGRKAIATLAPVPIIFTVIGASVAAHHIMFLSK
eukprot:CAMPEP_0206164586 /NCGR_PEP_ID=MMETSP1474-20131121/17169_1 /ASSEMBLY_ACC=CAM_ASM_001110 /TAXON_ID=97495 /ORGANISM="Imantonia sp., Strain RCC918" /LENGTH=101 /DNA_ID=CAMNT_0053567543 /DNA_START=21 /DNA_END=323 /DNA_ORIENTATION=-